MEDLSKITKNFGQKMIFEKKKYSDSERAEHGLSPHGVISIFYVLMKIDFFGGGGGLKCQLVLTTALGKYSNNLPQSLYFIG